MTPGEKALAISYVHCKLLITNLEVTVHELKVMNDPTHKQLHDKLVKLKSASQGALRGIDKTLVKDGTLEELKIKIEKILDTAWAVI